MLAETGWVGKGVHRPGGDHLLVKGDHQGSFANRTYLVVDHQAEAEAAVGPAAKGMAIVILLILCSSSISGTIRKWESLRGKQSCVPPYSKLFRLNLRIIGRDPSGLTRMVPVKGA